MLPRWSEEKKDSGIESVGVVVGSDLRDDCMTAEVKAEDEEVKAEDDWDDKGCDGKIGFGEGSVIVVVVVWEFAMLWVIVQKLFVSSGGNSWLALNSGGCINTHSL